MEISSKNKGKKRLVGACGALALGFLAWAPALAAARVVTVGPSARAPVHGSPYYYPGTVIVEPLLLPRTGSNDYLYTYDNVYGAGASAAGRMERVVHYPQQQLYYPRQQPRVYLGY